jgi:hypothetical protein
MRADGVYRLIGGLQLFWGCVSRRGGAAIGCSIGSVTVCRVVCMRRRGVLIGALSCLLLVKHISRGPTFLSVNRWDAEKGCWAGQMYSADRGSELPAGLVEIICKRLAFLSFMRFHC